MTDGKHHLTSSTDGKQNEFDHLASGPMAFKRKYAGKRKRTFKKSKYGRKRQSAGVRALKSVRKIARRMHRERNAKYRNDFRVLSSSTISKITLNNTERDNSESGRVGNDLEGISLRFTLHYHLQTQPQTNDWWYRRVKLLFVRRKSSPSGELTNYDWDQIIDPIKDITSTGDTTFDSTSADLCAGYLKDHPSFEVLKDINLHLDNNNLFVRKQFTIPFKHHVAYADLLAQDDYMFKNQLVMLIIPLAPTIPNPADGQAVLQWGSKFEFYE